MTTDDKIRVEKLQFSINGEAAEISAVLSGKIDKFEYLTGEEILPPDQIGMMNKLNLQILL